MPFCTNCGAEINDKAKFCSECGSAVNNNPKREVQYAGKIIKCPNCGEPLHAFTTMCPVCGLELRSTGSVGSVKEFAQKIEEIESKREYEKPKGFFSKAFSLEELSKTDEQKISLIQSFPVPNTVEDILEFMILATSNVNYRLYNSRERIAESQKAVNDAWVSKIEQAYEKAKQSFGDEESFNRIEELYKKYCKNVKKQKKKGIRTWILMCGWLPLFLIFALSISPILGPREAKKETERLEQIESVALIALEQGEYKKALLNAELLDYSPSVTQSDTDIKAKQWEIRRELLIDRILNEAEQNGVHLERSPKQEEESTEPESSTKEEPRGFISGFIEGVRPGIETAKEQFSEFKKNQNGNTSIIESSLTEVE